MVTFSDGKTSFALNETVNFMVKAEKGFQINQIRVYDAQSDLYFDEKDDENNDENNDENEEYFFVMPENAVFIEVMAEQVPPYLEENITDILNSDSSIGNEEMNSNDSIVSDILESPEKEEDPIEHPQISEEDNETTEEASSMGGYVLAGYLIDGTPNYTWQGEGTPAVLENSYDIMIMSDELAGEDPGFFSARTGSNFNYLKDAVRILNTTAEMSDSLTAMSDGLHRMEDGNVRAYKSGRYFVNGRFGLDGSVYYADSNGYLYSGWLAVSKNSDITSKKKSNYVWKYCDPTTYVRFEGGLKTVDGILHYFVPGESGNLGFNKVVSNSASQYYYCDNYGICGCVKLEYDTSSAADPYPDTSYLAVNQIPSQNVVNMYEKVMDGTYSFYPKWYPGTSKIEVWGFTPISTSSNTTVYCPLTDDSMKGKIGCWYRNVGRFNGRQIDIKCTITDYTFYNLNGEREIGYFQVSLNKIGLNATNLRDITANMEFYDHDTGQPVKVKGFATFADIDICQGLEILSGTDNIYVDENCRLYKDPSRNLFTAPWEEKLNGSTVGDADRENWVQADYDSYNLSYKFYSARENYIMTDEGSASGGTLKINGESKCVWANDYTGNANDYDIVNSSQGVLWQGWQGLYYGRLGRVSISPLTKTVNDTDEQNILINTLAAADETFMYKLYHYVPSETENFYYDEYEIYDDIHPDLDIDASSLKVELDDGTDVSDYFNTYITGQRVTFSAKENYLTEEFFYNNNYCFCINVSLRESTDLEAYKENGYSVKNIGHASFSRTLASGKADQEIADSNETETTLFFPRVSIKKLDVNTNQILEDAEFEIYEYSGLLGDYKETGIAIPYDATKNLYISSGLKVTTDNQGNFKIKETKPPKGYKGNWETTVSLSSQAGQKEFTVTNEPDILPRGSIIVVKKIKESDITWAHGNPTFLFKVNGSDARGNEHTYEDFVVFEKDNYTTDENGYAVMQTVFSDIPIGIYNVTEKKVLRYYLAETSANSSNVTVRIIKEGTYGNAPQDTSYAEATLSEENPEASVTFRNEKARFDDYSHTDAVKNTITFA